MENVLIRASTDFTQNYTKFITLLKPKFNFIIVPIITIHESYQNLRYIILISTDISQNEYKIIKKYLKEGAYVLAFADINCQYYLPFIALCDDYHLKLTNNSSISEVISLNGTKSYHPKESIIHYTCDINYFLYESHENIAIDSEEEAPKFKFSFIYPYGLLLYFHNHKLNGGPPQNINHIVCYDLLSTGSFVSPANSCICALSLDEITGGRFCVIGSSQIFADVYMQQTQFQNQELLLKIIAFLFVQQDLKDFREIKTLQKRQEIIPVISNLAHEPRICFFHSPENYSTRPHNTLNKKHTIKKLIASKSLHGSNSKASLKFDMLLKLAQEFNVNIDSPDSLNSLKPKYPRTYPHLKLMLHPLKYPEPLDVPELPEIQEA